MSNLLISINDIDITIEGLSELNNKKIRVSLETSAAQSTMLKNNISTQHDVVETVEPSLSLKRRLDDGDDTRPKIQKSVGRQLTLFKNVIIGSSCDNINIAKIDPENEKTCANIYFDAAKHAYYLDCGNGKIIQNKMSVTELLKYLFKENFPGVLISRNIGINVKRGGNKAIEYPFLDKTLSADQLGSEILKHWNTKGRLASTYGTAMHALIEDYFKTNQLGYRADLHREITIFLKFLIEYQPQPFAMEYFVFHPQLNLAGSIDGIFLSATDNYQGTEVIIIDWKRTKDLDKSFSKRKFEGQNFDTSKRLLYSMQVNIYKYLFERKFNNKIKVVGMFLWVVDPTSTDIEYELYRIPEYPCMRTCLERFEANPETMDAMHLEKISKLKK